MCLNLVTFLSPEAAEGGGFMGDEMGDLSEKMRERCQSRLGEEGEGEGERG